MDRMVVGRRRVVGGSRRIETGAGAARRVRSIETVTLPDELRTLALATKGFMPEDEGDALYAAAIAAGRALPDAPWVEVGSYCGRSTIWLGAAARRCATVVFAVDHHRGSEENQPGWEWHEPDLVDPAVGKMDTLPHFRKTIHDAGLEDTVIAVVGSSPRVAQVWATPLAVLFIDGGHGEEPTRLDYEGWTPQLVSGGICCIHDVFEDPKDGGQAPYEQIYKPAIESGRFEETQRVGSLRVLRRG
jgi:predicted O-methyltransferase YrrM